jgi:hypothetical protein
MRTLSAVATRRPDMRLGAATESVRGHLAECGFQNITLVPYPMERSTTDAAGSPFRHVLFAGAARQDKGFHHVVDIVARWSHAGRDVPLTAQVGGDYFGRMDAAVRADLTRLEGLDYPHLSPAPGGLDPTTYGAQFRGALCLQLYDPVAFQDRASGVTLDAFLACAPVIAWEGTWISRQIERFGAGLTVPEGDLAAVIDSVDTIIHDYPSYADAARRAGAVLADEHDPKHLVDAIVGDDPTH